MIEARHLGLSSTDYQKLVKVIELSNQVLKDEGFKAGILASKYQGSYAFANSGQTASQVWAGIEVHLIDKNFVFTASLYFPPWYKRWSSGVAHSTNDGFAFWASYFRNSDIATLAGTTLHELMHYAFHYEHDFNATARRPYSVPYRVGNVAYEVASRIVRDAAQRSKVVTERLGIQGEAQV